MSLTCWNTPELLAAYDRMAGLTVWQSLEETAARLPEKVALVDGDRRFTYAELVAAGLHLSQGLAALGLAKGDIAAVYLPNSAEQVTLFYALQHLGVAVAWLNPSYRQTEAEFILANSGAKAILLFEQWQGHDYLSSILGIPGLPHLELILVARHGDDFTTADPRVRTLDDVLAAAGSTHARPAAADATPVGPDDLSMLIYTSGTTGRSKGAAITQSQVVRAGYSYSLGVSATEDDIFVAFLPMSHSYGCGALLLQPLILGATVVLLDVFSAERAFQLIERERVTIQLGSPTHYVMELKSPVRSQYDLSSLRAGLIAGMLAPAGLITQVEREMGVHIASFLGSSEVGPGLSIILPFPQPLEVRERSIGYALTGTEAKVVDPETGQEKAPGEPGELVLSGWHVTQGYWKNPEETARQIRDGWLYTGDLVSRDEDGCFQILGRLKEWINRGGFKIVPSELEGLLVQRPEITEVCVVATPNPVLGESICVCILVNEDADPPTLAELRSFLEGRVAPYKLPDELLVLEEFPRLSGGIKVNKLGPGGVAEQAKTSPDKETHRR